MIRVLLADDEELARQRLRKLLSAFEDVTVIGEVEDGQEAMQRIADERPDAIFLDIEMPGASGLEVAQSLASPRPRIVFCTGYDQYAVDAFELHALDYLLKPVTRERLERTIHRLRQAPSADWDSSMNRMAKAAGKGQTRFLVHSGAQFRVVGQNEVEYFSSEDKISTVHTASGCFWMEPTLNALEERIDPALFYRISRSAIVRLDFVLEVVPLLGGYGEIRLRNGVRLPVSRRRFRDLLARLGSGLPSISS